MDNATVMNAFAAAGLSRVARELGKVSYPSIRITAKVTDESDIPLGNSKLGGLPDLPPNVPWPDLKGVPMSFIAQIRLSDLRKFDAAKDLPATGLLSFFYDANQQTFGDKPSDRGGWAVIYRDGAPVPAQLNRLPAPDHLPAKALFKACSMSFNPEWTLPADLSVDVPKLELTDKEQTGYEKLYANYPNASDHASIHHRLLGHPNTLQDDMRSQAQLLSHGVSSASDPKVATLQAGTMNWRLLLQVDSDEHAGMKWANNGMLYYWIESDALSKRHFDNTWLVLQSE